MRNLAIVADMTTHDISQLPVAVQDYIRALETQVAALNERIEQFEEQFLLAQSKRFAPSSEKWRRWFVPRSPFSVNTIAGGRFAGSFAAAASS